MVRTRRNPAGRRSARNATASSSSSVPDVYREMLAEADTPSADRPIKKRRLAHRKPETNAHQPPNHPGESQAQKPDVERGNDYHHDDGCVGGKNDNDGDDDDDDDDDLQFEDIPIPTPSLQTLYRDSDEEDEDDEEDEVQFEDVDLSSVNPSVIQTEADFTKDLELDLTARTKTLPSKSVDRRKPMTRAEKDRRIEIHKTHLLCLLSNVARRNRWCNDPEVQGSLRPLLNKKMITELNPPDNLTQFGQANSLKEGLTKVNTMFKIRFRITERGMRRALWAEDEESLQNYTLPADTESPLDKFDFREAAKSLSGSRDVGAQLYCALLRAAGVEARLVCSLQPLSFSSAGPYMAPARHKKEKKSLEERYGPLFKDQGPAGATTDTGVPSPRRRLGHPSAAAFRFAEPTPAPSRQATPTGPKIRESLYPVYWVEVLDHGHQKWQPTDALVTDSFWKPQKFEPPASDRENSMAYVVAFEEDGTAKDVTRRYAKAYNAKTRRLRIESALSHGERWWRKALRLYSRGYTSDLDQIELNELTAAELREPMPRNIADFKDHPVYALERHLRRHEVLVPNAVLSGTVGAGNKGSLEKIYRRSDVRIARSKDKWYRLGREVRPDELPVKFLIKPSQLHEDLFSDEVREFEPGETNGTPIYTIDQTEKFKAPPVRNGKVPKNRYGNIDLYVPSMVPDGGTYIADDLGAQAAFTLGVDYAPALTGFQFKGRQGTAVLYGVVVATENEEAVRAVMDGLRDQEAELEQDRRSRQALKAWRRFLMNLRIRQKIWAGVSEDSGDEAQPTEGKEEAVDDHDNDGGQSTDDERGGGFEIDDDYAGGFVLD
ncbi:Rad4-domain-containing protein [Xylariaceae sp. FL0255]|nr:Rad4-domain-containing protein [Xylariaceae sp. FL0255]